MNVSEKRFDFGLNWKDYSDNAFNEARFEDAKSSLRALFDRESFEDLSFLDVGCGSGIFSIAAHQLGAKPVCGIDISHYSIETCNKNSKILGPAKSLPTFQQADVLDASKMAQIGQYDLVYAWGSLHHTGSLWTALEEVTRHVKQAGTLALAVYHKHWTSPVWLVIKKFYNRAPKWAQRIMIFFFYPVLFGAKFAITGKNPLKMRRGMDFYYDVVDWIGGYPYEYALPQEIIDFLHARGFQLRALYPAAVPTGNNEFVFRRIS